MEGEAQRCDLETYYTKALGEHTFEKEDQESQHGVGDSELVFLGRGKLSLLAEKWTINYFLENKLH